MYGLKINKAKTKIMIIDRAQNNQHEVRSSPGYETESVQLSRSRITKGVMQKKYKGNLLWTELQRQN